MEVKIGIQNVGREIALELFWIEPLQPKISDADLTDFDVGYGFKCDAGRCCHRARISGATGGAQCGRFFRTRSFGEPGHIG